MTIDGMGLLVRENNKACRGGIHEVLQLCYVALGSHNGEGTVNMSFMMKNREGETPYHGMMHWIPVMSFDV